MVFVTEIICWQERACLGWNEVRRRQHIVKLLNGFLEHNARDYLVMLKVWEILTKRLTKCLTIPFFAENLDLP